MEEAFVQFHVEEGGTMPAPRDRELITTWVTAVVEELDGQLGPLNYIFCGDDYLHRINVEYLRHDTLTDIITFPYDLFPVISGDLFISTERVADNAADLRHPYREELHRVMIHGVLHLSGQGDKTESDSAAMRRLEDWALSLRSPTLQAG